MPLLVHGGGGGSLAFSGDTTTVNNTTTPTSLLGSALRGSNVFDADTIGGGTEIVVNAWGTYSRRADTTNSVTFDLYINGSAVANWTTGALALTAGIDGGHWTYHLRIRCSQTGTVADGGAMRGGGHVIIGDDGAGAIVGIASATDASIDTTIENTFDLYATWSSAGDGDSIVCQGVSIDA